MSEHPPIAIAITNMRETAIAWDRKTGKPVHDGIMWMSNQSQNIVDRWEAAGFAPMIRDRTGLSNHTFFFGSKIAWLFDREPSLLAAAERGEIAIGTVESWLLYVLTGGIEHATDLSNASRYQLLNLSTLQWDEELAEALGIPLVALPALKPTSAHFGVTDAEIAGVSVPITGMIGDQQASLLGHGAVNVGDAKATFGTSCVVGVNLGTSPSLAPGLVTSIAWADAPGEAVYEMEGSAFHSGFTMTWLTRILSLPAAEQQRVQRSAQSAERRVTVVPAFTGMGAPTWLSGTGATISGLTMDTEPSDILRAGIESMAFQAFELISAVPVTPGTASTGAESALSLSVDGGAASNDYLCQLLADLSGRTIVRPPSRELTGVGAAIAAATTLGFPLGARPSATGEHAPSSQASECFVPQSDTNYGREGFAHWKKTVVQHLS
jgi:glycerol kinase